MRFYLRYWYALLFTLLFFYSGFDFGGDDNTQVFFFFFFFFKTNLNPQYADPISNVSSYATSCTYYIYTLVPHPCTLNTYTLSP